MKRTLSFAALALLLFSVGTTRADFNPSEWKNQQEIRLEQTGLIKFSVPIETLDAARADLRDLRVIGEQGNEIPYAVERVAVEPRVIRQALKFETALLDQSSVVMCATGVTQPIDGLWLETPSREFIKAVRIEGSADGKTWKVLAQGQPIFRQLDGAANLHLVFPAGTWSRLRLTLDDRRAPPIPIFGIQIQVTGKTAPSEPFEIVETGRTEGAGETRIMLRVAGAHVTLAELSVETSEPVFTRQATLLTSQFSENELHEVALAKGTLYRVQMEGAPSVSNLSFAGETTLPSRNLILVIHNQDSPPLKISKVRAARRPVHLVLSAAKAGPLRLMTGNARANAPHYDLASLAGNFSKMAPSRVSMGPMQVNPLWHPSETLPELSSVGSAIDVSGWKFRKSLKVEHAGIQHLELDPEVLSRTRSSLESLRIVAEGKQVPYVLERTGLLRNIKPVVEPADDPKRPKTGRWSLKLPYPSLPILQLTCATSNSIFRREARLLEEVADERGVSHWWEVGSATWVRASGQNKMKLRMTFHRPPSTDRLILEVDNGDNAPLQLEDFEVWYTATRLFFKASPGAPMHLYYDNPKIGAPQYDIGLVADQILSAEKVNASLEKEERLGKPSPSESLAISSKAGVLFWVVLVAIVGMLLVVMARLLPKK